MSFEEKTQHKDGTFSGNFFSFYFAEDFALLFWLLRNVFSLYTAQHKWSTFNTCTSVSEKEHLPYMLLACVHASHILCITLYTYWRRTQISHCIYIILYSLYSHHSTKQVRPNFIWYYIIWTFIYVSICWECRNWNPNFLVSLSLSFLLDTQGILNYIIVIGYFRFSMF